MAAADSNFKECLAELIATPSVSSVDPALDMGNRPLAELLANWFEDLGFSVECLPVADGKVNVLAKAGRGDGGLVLSGHTDTVPCDEHAWTRDPFKLEERDGRLYGLGTSDMKSFFAFVREALRALGPGALKRPLYLLGTCDEESSMAGARALVESGRPLGRYALIGEPTGLQPVILHKGAMMESIRLIGRAGHASDPALGNNALEGMHAVMDALMQWREELQRTARDERFQVPVPTLNFGCIRGGDNPNRICAECELKIDMRILPGTEIEDARSAMRRAVLRAVDGSGLIVEFGAIMDGVPALATPETSEIVKCAERLSGRRAGSVAFGTEGPYLNAMGMDTVILGAGDIAQAHQADEYLATERIAPMLAIVQGIIEQFCGAEESHAG
ncbi:MAG: acetylornithine deacetylase [Gammaproteobacteria bacterium]|nr:acetylornithine deacetylase [Gammaproteobacteria bacterium]